jgi:hypothetical protein
MCTNLQRIYDRFDGSFSEVRCRKCSRCLLNRLTDFCGRAYAESRLSSSFFALTLTYADSSAVNSQVLVYRDIQLLFKRLRRAGYSVRYIVAGEYGSKRGRAHWHCVLFFDGEAPSFPLLETQCQTWEYWPHGFTFVQRPDYSGLMYVLKYAMKDDGSEHSTRRVMMSKKPPLGARYWDTLSLQRLSAGLPFSLSYSMDGANYANGNVISFRLSGASLELAYRSHRSAWFALGNRSEPLVFVDDYEPLRISRFGSSRSIEKDSPRIKQFYDFRSWGLSHLSHSDQRKTKLVLTVPHGFVYRLPSGELFALTFDRKVVRRWVVPNLAALIGLVRGRSVLPNPVLPPFPLGLTPF